MSVELVLAAVGAADLCLKYGKRLFELYRTFKEADDNIKDKVLLIESTWSRTAIQVEFFQRVAHGMNPEHCRIQFEVLETLKTKLLLATQKVESLLKDDPSKPSRFAVKKPKYILFRESLDKVISDLEQWQRIFDPCWYLIARMGDRIIDSDFSEAETTRLAPATENRRSSISSSTTLVAVQSLRKLVRNESMPSVHVSLPEDGLNWESARPIPNSTTQVIQRVGSGKLLLVDSISCDSNVDIPRARADAEALAKKLKRVEPDTFSLLPCYGLVRRKDKETGVLSSINLVFRTPVENPNPTSLRGRLLKGPAVSLTTVIDIAKQLAMAVSFVHTCDFVHKNIRPETILFLPKHGATTAEGGKALVSVYLLGFDRFRNVNFQTMRNGDEAWERNIYRHPLRQGARAQENYVMQHDIYSLGVCLLEIGLWNSFVTYGKDEENPTISQNPAGLPYPSPTLGLTLSDFDYSQPSYQPGSNIKNHLVNLAKERLPQRMGDRYTAIVVTCLTCLDGGNEDFGDEEDMQDDDGILIGVRFIEKILFRLSEISV
ncbi:hypothetical protein M426DRAFT_325684 [Hypoxylon sp. CI-4A]|nr:hypothetical protein M426DRAFT_325684 [Hypoxylon sp. CI-4A]